jgi:hypothetical protein
MQIIVSEMLLLTRFEWNVHQPLHCHHYIRFVFYLFSKNQIAKKVSEVCSSASRWSVLVPHLAGLTRLLAVLLHDSNIKIVQVLAFKRFTDFSFNLLV